MNQDNSVKGTAPSRPSSSHHTGELSLLDVVVYLWRGKAVIAASVLVAVLLAGIYIMVAKEKWTSSAIVTLPAAGQVANYNAALSVLYAQSPQDKPAIGELQNQLFDRFSASASALAGQLENLDEPLQLKVERVQKDSSSSLRISYVGQSAKSAKEQLTRYINQLNDEVVSDYGADIRRNLSVKTRELTDSLATQKQVALDKKELRMAAIAQSLKIAEASNITETGLNQAEFLSDDTLYLLGSRALQAMIVNEQSKPLIFDQRYYDTQSALLAMTHLKIQVDNLQSFRYIAPADQPIRRSSPKRTLAVLLAALIGTLLGSTIVLGRVVSRQYRQLGKP